jgi:hypothetical protein
MTRTAVAAPARPGPAALPRCSGLGESFFPEPRDRQAVADARKTAKRLCAGKGGPDGPCPLREACLRAALDTEDGHGVSRRHGFWGGLSPVERWQLDRLGRALPQLQGARR